MSKKPKIGTAIKKATQAIGIEQCVKCEEREFFINKWTHKKPIRKVDPADKDFAPSIPNVQELYLKYFGLDNIGSENKRINEIMLADLNKLFEN
jgi:hypothetical protein